MRRLITLDPLFANVSAPVAALTALAIGFAYPLWLFGPDVVLDGGHYWSRPVGRLGGALDIRTTLSGYYWFVQDEWRWPLLSLPNVNLPEGANAGLTDIVPLLGILGRLARTAFGTVVNPFPFWVAGTFALNALALVGLVRSLGVRSLAAAIVAAAIGVLSPIMHHRFGHLALMAHWLPVFTLALHFNGTKPSTPFGRYAAGYLGLCLLAIFVNLYIYVMTAVVAGASVVQAAYHRRIGLVSLASTLCGLLAVGALPLWAFGMFDDPTARLRSVEFGMFSMNMASPFWPQTSGAFAWTGQYYLTRGSIGATAGQYEGYAYLGIGALLLLAVGFMREWRDVAAGLRTHWVLACAMSVLTLWALSNRVYLGPILVLSYEIPDILLRSLFEPLRSSGRFFWPVAWLLAAFGVAASLRSLRRPLALFLGFLAIFVQFIDTSIWRTEVRAAIASAAMSAFDDAEVNIGSLTREFEARRRVMVVPSYFCLAGYDTPMHVVAVEIELLAARSNAVTNSVYLARSHKDCERERETDLATLTGSGLLIALVQPDGRDRTVEAQSAFDCRRLTFGLVCVNRTSERQ